ncbi:MAG: Flp pilus assembly protein CpaB [Acidimicrobiia bacterium]
MRLPRLARTPFAFWLAVAGLALATALVVAGALNRVSALAARYGPLRPVVVAARPVERGTALAAADLEVRSLPATFLPAGAVGSVDDVRGRAPAVPLLPGQAVLQGHLAPEGLSGAAALLPAGARAVAVPADGVAPTLRVGDVVDVLVTLDGDPTLAVAVDALVVEAGEGFASVAVSPETARVVAYAVANGSVTLALSAGLRGPNAEAGLRGPNAEAGRPQRNLVASSPSTAAPAASR